MRIEKIILLFLLLINSANDIKGREILLLPTLGGIASGYITKVFFYKETVIYILFSIILSVCFLSISLIKSDSFGMGDALVITMISAWEDVIAVFEVTIGAMLMFLTAIIILNLRKIKKETMPFVPFIYTAYLVYSLIL